MRSPGLPLGCLSTPNPHGEHCSITIFLESTVAEKLRLWIFVQVLFPIPHLNVHLIIEYRLVQGLGKSISATSPVPVLPSPAPLQSSLPGRSRLGRWASGAMATVSLVGQLLQGSRQEGEVIQSRERTGVPGSMPGVGGKEGPGGGSKIATVTSGRGDGDPDPGITRLLKGSSEVRGPSGISVPVGGTT